MLTLSTRLLISRAVLQSNGFERMLQSQWQFRGAARNRSGWPCVCKRLPITVQITTKEKTRGQEDESNTRQEADFEENRGKETACAGYGPVRFIEHRVADRSVGCRVHR